ncbi:helix-turn-helix domain-containing protein [Phaeobacter sp. NW0010-22]|uniref:helix-turn-helix domain-containing protein n=1 Tax=Phaeobacter sp. NW0010-22 TaxID=3135907 RepID=UPI00310A600E
MKLDIKSALARTKYSQSKLAEEIDISRGYMSEIVSGKKDPSLETLHKIMEVLELTPSELYGDFEERRPIETPAQENVVPGFAEPEASAFTPKPNSKLSDAISILYPSIKHPSVYQISGPAMGFMVAAGDLLVLDLNASPQRGDLCLATLVDTDTGEAKTVLRKWIDGWLISNHATNSINHIDDTNPSTALVGIICGTIRNSIEN